MNVKAPSFILMTAGLKTHANKTILHKGKKKSIKSCYINKMLKILMLWSSSCLSIKQQIMSKRSQKKNKQHASVKFIPNAFAVPSKES